MPLRAFAPEGRLSRLTCRQYHMRNTLIVAAAAVAAIPGMALAQPSPVPPVAAPPASAHANAPHADANWNTDHFHFGYNDGGCHFVYDYNFKTGDMHLDRHGDCSSVSVPHP